MLGHEYGDPEVDDFGTEARSAKQCSIHSLKP